jgi:hypothetical protein
MTGQGHNHGWAWEGISPPTGKPGQANQNEFFPQKGLYYRQKYTTAPHSPSLKKSAGALITDRNPPQFHQLSGWLVSNDPAGEEARCGGPGLVWLHVVCGELDMLQNSLKLHWSWLMVDKLTLNSLTIALVDIPAVRMTIAHSLNT